MEIYKILVKFALKLHNLSYKLSTKFAIKAESGLHPKHRIMDYHRFFIDNINVEDMVLDIGCGNGFLTYDVAEKTKKVLGIDISSENIERAKKTYNRPNLNFIVGDATKYNFSERFDTIILSNILEHIENRIAFLRKIKNLTPKILVRVPMINRDWITLYKKELGVEYKLDKTHFIEYTLASFQEELQKAGLKIQSYSIQFGEIWAVIFAR